MKTDIFISAFQLALTTLVDNQTFRSRASPHANTSCLTHGLQFGVITHLRNRTMNVPGWNLKRIRTMCGEDNSQQLYLLELSINHSTLNMSN